MITFFSHAPGEAVNITVYEVDPNGHPMELYCACSLEWGGKRVDMAFEKALSDFFTDELIKNYRGNYTEDYNELLGSFKIKKCRYGKESSNPMISLKVPVSFIDECTKEFGTDLTNFNKKSRFYQHLVLKRDLMKLDIDTLEDFFQPVCDGIIKLVKKVLQAPNISNVQYMLMAGGFAESPLLQDAIRKAFPQCQVNASHEVGRAVLRGAISYGLHQMIPRS